VARLGGDEFAVLIPGVPDQQVVAHAAERIIKALEEPFVLGGLALSIEASIGIGLYPEHGNKVDTVLQRADSAMYLAKHAHEGFRFYTDEDDKSSRRKLALVGELRRAVEEKEIILYYQPKASLTTGKVVGVEALARWNHPERGLLPPDEFIPLLEQTNLLKPFTDHVVDTALAQVRQWRLAGHEVPVAVNLSMRNLLDGNLVDDLRSMLTRWSVEPAMLELELTETTVMSEPRRTLAALQALHELGVALSVDDFGTGYSSLAYLRDLPIDRIKIDKSFVMTMEELPKNLAIVRSTIDLGRNLGLEVVAEGVETAAACATLAGLGCDYAQGYVMTPPISVAQLTHQLAEMTLPLPERVEPSLTAVAGGRVA
jgi:predicted signal transduction protein with EAL and GGDEF domain